MPRWPYFVIAGLIYVPVLLFCCGLGGNSQKSVQVVPIETVLVTTDTAAAEKHETNAAPEKPRVEAANMPPAAAPESSGSAARPIQYAGVPGRPKGDPVPSSTSTLNYSDGSGAKDTSAAGEGVQPTEEQLQRAMAVYRKGERCPGYMVQNISAALMMRLIERRWAKLYAVTVPSNPSNTEKDYNNLIAYAVNWHGQDVMDIRLAQGNWFAGLANRGVTLPPFLAEPIRHAVQAKYGCSAEPILFLSPSLDQVVLAKQIDAADQRGVQIADVADTEMQFLIKGSEIEIVVIQVHMQKKRGGA